jgi:flagellar motor switch protein FliM
MGHGSTYECQGQQRVNAQHLRRLQALHEDLARDFGAALSTLLRTPVDVTFTGIEQVTYGQFAYNIETPACFYLLQAEPLNERLMLDIEPVILHSLIDRLLGGGGEEEPPPRRPLTEIELCVAARVVCLFLQECVRSWKKVLDLRLDVLQVESNPRLLRLLPADESVLLAGFEVVIGRLRGMMRYCLPCRAIERIGDKLLPEKPTPISDSISDSLTEVKVTLAETQIKADDLTGLCVGDIITTETEVSSPAILSIAGAARFRAKPGVYQGRKAVVISGEIQTPLSPGQDGQSPTVKRPE